MEITMHTSRVPMTLDMIRTYAPSALAETAHESRSERYEYIPTTAVIQGLQREGFEVFAAAECRTRTAGKAGYLKHLLRFRHSSVFENLTAVGDTIPEVVLVNSHDGTSAYKLMSGLFRLVCENGLVVADSLISSVNVRHTGDVVREVIEASFQVADQSRKAIDAIAEWKRLVLSSGEQAALAVAAHHVRFADADGKVNTPITPQQLLHIRRHEDNGADLWSTFNRVQENVIKGGLSARGISTDGSRARRVSTRRVNGIDQDVKLNRALWTLGQKMAELKNAAKLEANYKPADAYGIAVGR
jgi:hypothetical protein